MNYTKEQLSPKDVSLNDNFWENDNAQVYLIKDSKFEFSLLWKKSQDKNCKSLIVSLNSGRQPNKNQFERISWSEKTLSHFLIIEDPLKPRYNYGSWFFGDKDHSILQDIIFLIKKACTTLNLSNSDIFFIGSSSGGYAALYLANYFSYSTAIASNPQIDITLVTDVYSEIIKQIGTINKDNFNRLNIDYICDNTKSNFNIFYSPYKKSDNNQILLLQKKLRIVNFDCFTQYKNFCFMPNKVFSKIFNLMHRRNQLLQLETELLIDVYHHKCYELLFDAYNIIINRFELTQKHQFLELENEILKIINALNFKIKYSFNTDKQLFTFTNTDLTINLAIKLHDNGFLYTIRTNEKLSETKYIYLKTLLNNIHITIEQTTRKNSKRFFYDGAYILKFCLLTKKIEILKVISTLINEIFFIIHTDNKGFIYE